MQKKLPKGNWTVFSVFSAGKRLQKKNKTTAGQEGEDN
jgi:hypothetical protein